MLDIKLMRDQAEHVRERLRARGAGDEARVDEVLALDEQRRKGPGQVEFKIVADDLPDEVC